MNLPELIDAEALIQQDLGKLVAAETWMNASSTIDEANYEPTHPQLGISYSNMVAILIEKGEQEQACELWVKAYWIFHEVLGKQHPHTGVVMNFLRQHCPECFNQE